MTPTTVEERIRRWHTSATWLQLDPVAHWNEMREHTPTARSEQSGGYWILTRHEDIEWAARQPETFSSAVLGIPHRDLLPVQQIPIQLDGAEHQRWRRLLFDLFAPKAVDGFTGQIRQAAAGIVDGIAGTDSCEFIADFAVPLPAETFLLTFGVGREHLKGLLEFKDWLLRVGIPAAQTAEDIAAVTRPLWEFFGDAVDKRQAQPGTTDILSRLLADGVATRDEIINIAFGYLLAGLETTTAALGMAFLHLAQHPEHQDLIAASPERIPAVVGELLRAHPVVTTARVVTRDVERHGVTLREGDHVLMSWGMSGLDPAVFRWPDRVDFDRTTTRSLAFGAGVHRCLGMHLARRIIEVALEEWHARIPRYRLTPGAAPVHHYTPVRGLNGLSLNLD